MRGGPRFTYDSPYMKSWWLPLLPVLVCAPCLAVSLGLAGLLTGGLVAVTGLLATPVGLLLFLVGAAAAGFGLVQVMHRQVSCDPSLSNGGRG